MKTDLSISPHISILSKDISMYKLLLLICIGVCLQSCVSNEGDIVSPEKQFSVTVVGGSGTGRYPAGSIVTVRAETMNNDSLFEKWASSHPALISDSTFATASFIMPEQDVVCNAVFQKGYRVFVNNTLSKTCRAGDAVVLSADERTLYDSIFIAWSEPSIIKNYKISHNTLEFIMPSTDIYLRTINQSTSSFETVSLYNPWAVKWESKIITDSTGLTEGVISAVDLKNNSIIENMQSYYSADMFAIYSKYDSAYIDLKVVNNYNRSSYTKPILTSVNGTKYARLSEDEVSRLTLSMIHSKTSATQNTTVDFSAPNTWYVAKLARERGYALLTGDVNSLDSTVDSTNHGSISVRFIHFPNLKYIEQ